MLSIQLPFEQRYFHSSFQLLVNKVVFDQSSFHKFCRGLRHTSRTPRILVGLVQKSRTKVLCTNSISIVRGGFCPGGFVRVDFCPFPLLSQYICYNRKLNIILNFMFYRVAQKSGLVTFGFGI